MQRQSWLPKWDALPEKHGLTPMCSLMPEIMWPRRILDGGEELQGSGNKTGKQRNVKTVVWLKGYGGFFHILFSLPHSISCAYPTSFTLRLCRMSWTVRLTVLTPTLNRPRLFAHSSRAFTGMRIFLPTAKHGKVSSDSMSSTRLARPMLSISVASSTVMLIFGILTHLPLILVYFLSTFGFLVYKCST